MIKGKINRESTPKKLRHYLESPEMYEVDAIMEEKLDMIQFCRELIEEDKTTPQMIASMREKFGIGQTKAFNILNETDRAYSIRAIKIEKLFAEINATKIMAVEKNDPKSAAACDRNRLQAIRDFYGTKDKQAYEDLQPQEVLIGEFKELTVMKDVKDSEIDKFIKNLKKKALQKATQFAEDVNVDEENTL